MANEITWNWKFRTTAAACRWRCSLRCSTRFSPRSPRATAWGLRWFKGLSGISAGRIHLASEPGRGTTFRILLPSAPAAAEEAAGQLSSAGEPARELLAATVLIVEDEDVLRQSVAKMLRRIGGRGARSCQWFGCD